MRRLIYLLLFLISFSVSAQIKYVSPNQKIQNAIDKAIDGDIIIVKEGNYCQQINFKGKAITVASEFYLDGDTSHISKTIIDGIFFSSEEDSSSLVYFINGEDTASVLMGFTLQNGKGTYNINKRENWRGGGAVFIEKSGATVKNNIIINNQSIIPNELVYPKKLGSGGGINVRELPEDKSVIITDNLIKENIASGTIAFGGGICAYWCYGTVNIYKNKILVNQAIARQSGYGGGICISAVSNDSHITLENNFISDNSINSSWGASKGGGIACYFSSPVIRNNVIVYNKTNYPAQYSSDAFGGGIAVHWYLNAINKYEICNPYVLLAIIENNTIAYNNDKLEGGGIALRSVGAKITNNIIGCNFAANNKQIKIEFPDAPESIHRRVDVQYSNVEGGFEGEGNINEFPNFTDKEKWYLKRDNSPCIDAGNYENKYNDVEDPNVSGQARFPALGKLRNDIGAFGGPNSKWTDDFVTDVKNIEITIPAYPSLAQNYPNPFNPTTTIKYSIPQINVGTENFPSVQIKIYDILGREIVPLVNQKQKPGNYEVKWDGLSASGGQVPSGIYFYKLITENYSLTKKMIFLK
jgi:hypothetical protein